jgi:hypothetical protein
MPTTSGNVIKQDDPIVFGSSSCSNPKLNGEAGEAEDRSEVYPLAFLILALTGNFPSIQ